MQESSRSDDEGAPRMTKGKWSEDERMRLLQGMSLYQRNWIHVAAYVGTRSNVQCRKFAKRYFEKVANEQGGVKEPTQAEFKEKVARLMQVPRQMPGATTARWSEVKNKLEIKSFHTELREDKTCFVTVTLNVRGLIDPEKLRGKKHVFVNIFVGAVDPVDSKVAAIPPKESKKYLGLLSESLPCIDLTSRTGTFSFVLVNSEVAGPTGCGDFYVYFSVPKLPVKTVRSECITLPKVSLTEAQQEEARNYLRKVHHDYEDREAVKRAELVKPLIEDECTSDRDRKYLEIQDRMMHSMLRLQLVQDELLQLQSTGLHRLRRFAPKQISYIGFEDPSNIYDGLPEPYSDVEVRTTGPLELEISRPLAKYMVKPKDDANGNQIPFWCVELVIHGDISSLAYNAYLMEVSYKPEAIARWLRVRHDKRAWPHISLKTRRAQIGFQLIENRTLNDVSLMEMPMCDLHFEFELPKLGLSCPTKDPIPSSEIALLSPLLGKRALEVMQEVGHENFGHKMAANHNIIVDMEGKRMLRASEFYVGKSSTLREQVAKKMDENKVNIKELSKTLCSFDVPTFQHWQKGWPNCRVELALRFWLKFASTTNNEPAEGGTSISSVPMEQIRVRIQLLHIMNELDIRSDRVCTDAGLSYPFAFHRWLFSYHSESIVHYEISFQICHWYRALLQTGVLDLPMEAGEFYQRADVQLKDILRTNDPHTSVWESAANTPRARARYITLLVALEQQLRSQFLKLASAPALYVEVPSEGEDVLPPPAKKAKPSSKLPVFPSISDLEDVGPSKRRLERLVRQSQHLRDAPVAKNKIIDAALILLQYTKFPLNLKPDDSGEQE